MGNEVGGQLVHSYDTERRRVLCGAVEQTRSTKHASGVTCPACRELLGRTTGVTQADGASSHDAG